MRVFQINVTANWGSTGRIVEDIGEKIITEGGNSYVAYGRYASSSCSHLIRIGSDIDVYIHLIFTRLWDRHGLASIASTKKLIKQIIKVQPDIIHLHNIHGYYLNYPLLFHFFSELNVPIVWTLHDCWSFTGHCTHYSFVKCNRWHTLCHSCPQKKKYPSSLLFDRSEQNFRDKMYSFTSIKNMVLVSVSEWLASEVRQSFLKKYPIKVIHNGIDTNIFIPKYLNKLDLGIDDKFVVLGVASIWSDRKGLIDFIKLREILSDDYIIILIGLNDKQIKKLPKGCLGVYRTNSIEELAKYYSVADVYVNTSVEETFGLTTIEAFACGTPAIVYNATACPEVITEETGFVVKQGDLIDVANKIDQIRRKGKSVYTEACRRRAVEFYDKTNKYNEYLKLYKELLN